MEFEKKPLGDAIATMLLRAGIKKNKNCNCQKRQEFLNRVPVNVPVPKTKQK